MTQDDNTSKVLDAYNNDSDFKAIQKQGDTQWMQCQTTMGSLARAFDDLEITKCKVDLRAKLYDRVTTFVLGLVVTKQMEGGGILTRMKL